jgi:flavin-dependent dehydrogenase
VSTASEYDVLVIGGGPAGSTAARLLSSWGWSVLVIQPADTGAHSLAESLPPSTRKLLQFLGQLDRMERARPYPNTGNLIQWAGAARATRPTDEGFHVSRARFDAVLRAGAAVHGAQIVDGIVRRIDDREPVRVEYTTVRPRERREAHGRYLLDCSGRAGVAARRGLRRPHPRARTLAIVAEWERDCWPADARTLTTVESYADGWAWSVPLSDMRRQCTVMMDRARATERSAGAFPPSLAGDPRELRRGTARPLRGEGGALHAIYERELAKATSLAARLAGARRVSRPWTCDSSLYDCSRAADGRTILVGDAASFIEPLSSAGVKKALLSAWRAAVVANTGLANPSMAGAAIDLHVRREQEVYAECMRTTSTFFAEAAAAYGTPFWTERAAPCSSANDSDAGGADASDGNSPLGADRVQDAFERLRRAGRVHPSAQLQFTPVPVIDGREVVMRDAVVVAGSDAPLQFAAGVDLAMLARIASACPDVPAIIDAYQRRAGAVPAAGLLTGLSLLVARHALVPEDSTV